MTATTVTTTGRATATASLRRMNALGRAELRLLWRNKTALGYALVMPGVAFAFAQAADAFAAGSGTAAVVVTGIAVIALGMVVYYNLVTAYVARREEYVLKRLRTGELTDAEILAGTALPSVVVAWLQVLAALVIGAAIGQLDMPVNPLLVLLAMVAGSVLFPLLAAASSALTRTVELAQVTTTPILVVPLLLCGLFAPIPELPDGFRQLAYGMPLTPVVDLMRLGLAGADRNGDAVSAAGTFAAALPSLGVAAAWIAVGLWATRRWFRWEPRR